MKTLRIALVALLITLTSIFSVSAKADTTPTLSKSGVTLSFPNPVYTVTNATSVVSTYINNSGYEVYTLGYQLTDKFGTVVAGTTANAYNVKNGSTGTIIDSWYSFELAKATAPYTITMRISYTFGSGKSDEFVSAPFEFIPRVAVAPTPTPTVTVTTTPAPAPTIYLTNPADQTLTEIATRLRDQVSSLNAKIKKICGARPKPKGC
jgi:hypothetical protein